MTTTSNIRMLSIRVALTMMAICAALILHGQEPTTSSLDSIGLVEVVVTHRSASTNRMGGPVDATRINRQELFKAACCNLGESFTTNPSVDVNYSDAATGARQIKLLGLSGTYVQMLAENIPNWRVTAIPYALGYVPGPWMKSIMVSKGASSVRNGYESITGQIDVEFLKPEDEQGATINLYGNSDGKVEANADANLHLNSRLNTELLAHYEHSFSDMDKNHDGFMDKPRVKQFNAHNRWDWLGDRYIFHGGISLLDEDRQSGQTAMDGGMAGHRYEIGLRTHRYEGYMKHAFFLNQQRGTNIALMASASLHKLDAHYGHKRYNVDEKIAYAQLMFETNFSPMHNLSAGLSINHDNPDGHVTLQQQDAGIGYRDRRETTSGMYAQYTFNSTDRVIVMAGMRVDHSSLHGTFFTPRLHFKYSPTSNLSWRISTGKGYRTTQALAQFNNLLASGRRLIIDDLKQEAAWNSGMSLSLTQPVHGRLLKVNLEYYYTHFINQTVVDYDTSPDVIHITNLSGKSYSHTFQVDVSYPILQGLELTAAYRLNDVRTTYNGRLLEKPLTSRYKGLLTASYRTPLGIWQVDVTLQLNGGGRMPTPYVTDDGTLSWPERFHAFEQLNVQVTRWFRHFSIYVGGENLTGRRQHHPIIAAEQPWSERFDPTLVWGPVGGAMGYAGIRINIGRTL